MIATCIIGLIAASLIAGIGYRAHALSRSGAIAAVVVGTITFGIGWLPYAIVLLAFFVPSVVLSRIGRAQKKRLIDIGKGGARDAWQVLANGGVATLCVLYLLWDDWFGPALVFAGAYAAATADTWATEIGTLARGKPRSILTGRPIATGLSGGVTFAGMLAQAAGALWIGLVAAACMPVFWTLDHEGFFRITAFAAKPRFGIEVLLLVTIAGFVGALADSVAGATIQELRSCPKCDRTCETDPHACGTATQRVRGIRGVNNDVVNFFATAVGALVAGGLLTVLRQLD